MSTFVKRDKSKDTAFTLVAPGYTAAGKQQLTFTIQFQSRKGMKILLSVQRFVSAIRWFDKAGKEISPMTKIALPVGTGEIQTSNKTFAVPANAKTANLQIGFDLPDISEKICLRFSTCRSGDRTKLVVRENVAEQGTHGSRI